MTETTDNGGQVPQDRACRILIAGTGGQGVILAARLVTEFFVQRGQQVLSGQLHGMAQRGGAVQSTIIVNRGVSPAIPLGGADFVVGFEPVETARALPYVSAHTIVVTNTVPLVPFSLSQDFVRGRGTGLYPDVKVLEETIRSATPNLLALNATELAEKAGSAKTLNMVMLGCLFGSSSFPHDPEEFMRTVITTGPPRMVETNMQAFRHGVEVGGSMRLVEETS